MPVIRQYTQEQSAQAAIPGRRAIAADFGGIDPSVGSTISNTAEVLLRQREDQEVSDVRKRLAQARNDLTEQWINVQNTAAPGDMTVASSFSQKMQDYFDKMRDTTITTAARKVFEQGYTELAGHFKGQALIFQADQAGKKAKLDFVTMRDNNARAISFDPSQYNALVAQDKKALEEGQGYLGRISPIDRQALEQDTVNYYARAAVSNIVENRPMDFLRAVKPNAITNQYGVPIGGTAGGTGFESAVDFVFKAETGGDMAGGGYTKHDGKSGTATKFGVNKEANPDVHIESLTKDAATKIYKERYWDAINADSLPPATAFVAFDTAVNMGVSASKDLLDRSGGDPQKMLDMRRDMYKRIVRNNPSQKKYLSGWLNRVDDLQAAVTGSDKPTLSEEVAASGSAPKINVPGFNDLPFNEQLQMIRQAETRANQIMSAGRAVMGQRLKDAEAEALSTGTVTSPPTRQELYALYGQEEGAKIYDSVLKTMQLGKDMLSVRGMSPADQEALLKNYTPAGGAGFAEGQARQDTLQKAIIVARKQRDTDPVQYAYNAVPEVKQAMDAMIEAGKGGDISAQAAATQKYATTVLAQQTRLGVKDPVLLTNEMADAIVRSFSNQAQGGQNAAALVRNLQATWGDNFQTMYQQLANKLPAAALVIPGMDDGPATLLAEASKLSNKEIWDGLDGHAKRDVDETLSSLLIDFQQTLVGSPSGPKAYSTYRDQIATLAAMYMRNGESAKSASKRAYQEVLAKNYTFTNTYRIPVSFDKKPVDSSLVESGAKAILESADSLPLRVARSSVSGTTVESDRKAMVSSIQSKGHWVTSKGEKGLTLYYGDSAIQDVNGNPIQFTWDQLQQRGAQQAASTDGLWFLNMLPVVP